MRAVKRERYGKKELERLKKTLGVKANEVTSASGSTEEMIDVSDVVTVTTKEEILVKQRKNDEESAMDVDVNGRKFNSKTLRDQNGSYPIWVHPRKIRKQKKGKKTQKKRAKAKNKKK